MIFYTFVAFIGLSMLRALANWRAGLILLVLVSAIQDPVRKLVPGTPGILALSSAPVFFAIVFSSMGSTRAWWSVFTRHHPAIGKATLAFIILCLPSAAISLTYGPGSWKLTLLGVFSYSVVLLGMVAGFHFSRGERAVRQLLSFYCVVHGVMLIGSLLEYHGMFPGWRILGDEAMGFNWIRYQDGFIVEMLCGFYRSADVMGWHAAAVSCLSIILATASHGKRRWFWSLLALWAVYALMLCGRRKMVYMLPLFALTLGWMYWQAGRSMHKVSLVGLLAIPIASLFIVANWLGDSSVQVRYYRDSADETLARLEEGTFDEVARTYEFLGFFGSGLGTTTPGSHHLKVARPRTWQESGPGRILAELGVLGALGFIGLVLSIAAALWKVTLRHLRERSRAGLYASGLVAFFVANAGSLAVSGFILADPFVAGFLGMMVGCVLSTARKDQVASQFAPGDSPAPAELPSMPVALREPS